MKISVRNLEPTKVKRKLVGERCWVWLLLVWLLLRLFKVCLLMLFRLRLDHRLLLPVDSRGL